MVSGEIRRVACAGNVQSLEIITYSLSRCFRICDNERNKTGHYFSLFYLHQNDISYSGSFKRYKQIAKTGQVVY